MNDSGPRISTFGKWMALTAALLGWMFDGLEMGLFPLVQKPALDELVIGKLGLVGAAASDARTLWMGIMTSCFLVGAATGGVFFGWLGDRIGRVRSMMLSVLTYAIVSGLSGFATDAWQIGVLRFIAALGMGGEWSLGVALINEIWPDRSRAFLAGLIGAAANVGYLLIGIVGLWVFQQIGQVREFLQTVGLSEAWAEHLTKNEGWRFVMMLGAAPALLTFFIRIFVPESARWERERDKGATSHWATRDLFSVLIGAAAAGGIIVIWTLEGINVYVRVGVTVVGFVIVTWGYTYPVIRYLSRALAAGATDGDTLRPTVKRMLFGATLSGVALLGTWGTIQQAPTWSGVLTDQQRKAEYAPVMATSSAALLQSPMGDGAIASAASLLAANHMPVAVTPQPAAKEWTQMAAAIGAILGTILAAMMGDWFGRRITYCILCIGSFISIQVFFQMSTVFDTRFVVLAFVTGAITASFYGWLPLYLPELFRTQVRATGQGFGFNFGRIIAAIGVLQLQNLQGAFGGLPQACAALSFIYVVGVIAIWFVPETRGQPLPE